MRKAWKLVFAAVILALAAASGPQSWVHAETTAIAGFNQPAGFAEPLVRTRPTSAEDDMALGVAVEAYAKRARGDDLSSLEAFVAEHPDSGWTPAIHVNLGLQYLHYGYFSRALNAWEKAWTAAKFGTEPEPRALADRAAGELAQLYGSLGHTESLVALLQEARERPVSGSATEAIQTAQEQLNVLATDPRHLFNCGPMALRALMLVAGATIEAADFLRWHNVGPEGTNLAMLSELAGRAEVAHEIVRRDLGEDVPVPSVVHWKVGHFATIVARKGHLYQVEDPVYRGQSHWITAQALDEEASGYFLILGSTAKATWRAVSVADAGAVWGKGPTNGTAPGGAGDPTVRPEDPDCGMCRYNIKESSVSVTLSDTPVGYVPPIGPPARTRISYNQREANQPQNFDFYNLGQKWTVNWLSYVTDDPGNLGASVTRFMSGGGAYYYSGYNSSNGRFAAQYDDGSALVLVSQSPVTYHRQLADGSVEIYALADGAVAYPRRVFLTQILDPQGNALSLSYDGQLRLTKVTDAVGRETTFSYDLAGTPRLLTGITDPFGRTAALEYDASGRLQSITDTIGLTSSFTYDANSLVNSMTTPYGTTTFAYTAPGTSAPPRFAQVTDPLGFSERVEWLEPAPVPASDPVGTVPQGMPVPPSNNFLNYRNSFYWDKDAYASAGCTPSGSCNYSMARNTHFTHVKAQSLKSTFIESIKYPLENRIWFNYADQPTSAESGAFTKPVATGRVLDDGTTQLALTTYDAGGYFNITKQVDPLGRTATYTYANQIDLTAVSQTTAFGVQTTLAQLAYNTKHRPILITDAAGETTRYSYNAFGQPMSITNPRDETTTYEYDADHNLARVINPNGETAATYTYDAKSQVRTYTDSEGWTLTYDYDDLGRVTVVTYPDTTTETYAYDRLDLAAYTDREHQVWRYTYDANQRLVTIADPQGGETLMGHDRTGQLVSLTDPNDNETEWAYDVQGRLTSKTFADASSVTYTYETTTSRLKTVTDALGQSKQFAYAKDDLQLGISYTGAVNPTPSVGFTYDPYFSRITSRTDGTGTTTYAYVPAGTAGALRVAQDNGALTDDTIAYAYDELGRVISRTIGLAEAEVFEYDAIGRLVHHESDLGSFALGYLGQTEQPASRLLSGSTLGTTWSYLDNLGDRRLAAIENTGLAAGQYSNFDFTTSPMGQYTSLEEDSDASTVYPPVLAQTSTFNDLNELTDRSGQALTYDANGNLLTDGRRTYRWDAENRLVSVEFDAEPGKEVTFAYDGLHRRVVISKTPAGGGSAVATSYVWCGDDLCQARDDQNNLVRAFFPEGEKVPGAAAEEIYYGVDQIGSVRRSFSTLTAQAYAFDPYGVALQSTLPATDFLYAGMFYDADIGLYLTKYRAYDAVSGRWLSPDPSRWAQNEPSTNLYTYAASNPVSFVDPNGLWVIFPPGFPFLGMPLPDNNNICTNIDWQDSVFESKSQPPWTNIPGSTVVTPGQSREYGSDGYPKTDRDAPHGGGGPNERDDHSHDWGRPPGGGPPTSDDRGPPRPPKPGDPPKPPGYPS